MRRFLLAALSLALLVGSTYVGGTFGCGGGSDTPAPTARATIGTITSSAETNLTSAAKASADDDCSGITEVVAKASDGTSVTDDSLENCAFSLELAIGKSYSFEFRNPNKKSKSFSSGLTVDPSSSILYPSATQQLKALKDGVETTDVTWKIIDGDVDGILKTSAGSKFTIQEGSDTIDLGTITIANGSANFNSDVVCNNPGNAKYMLCEDWTDTDPAEITGYGTIDENGLYTAPSELPEKNHIVVGVTDKSDNNTAGLSDLFVVREFAFDSVVNLTEKYGISSGTDPIALTHYERNSTTYIYGISAGTDGITLVKSNDGGETFIGTKIYSCATHLCSSYPDIAVDGNGVIYVVFSHGNPDPMNPGGSILSSDVYLLKSSDDGATFSSPSKINTTSDFNWSPAIAIDNQNTIHVVWQYQLGGTDYPAYTKSSDGATSFTASTKVADVGCDSWPKITIDSDGIIYIATFNMIASWYGNLYLLKSTDGGTTFTEQLQINDEVDSAYSVNWGHDIRANNLGDVYAVWGDVRNYKPQTGDYEDLFTGVSTDSGASFATSVKVSQTHNYNQYPSMALDGDGSPFVCWKKYNVPQTTTGMMFSRSVDGFSWTNEHNLNTASETANNQSCDISVDSSGKVYVFWHTSEPVPGSLFFVKSE